MKNIFSPHLAPGNTQTEESVNEIPRESKFRNFSSIKRCILDIFRKITGTYYALRQLEALQRDVNVVQGDVAALSAKMDGLHAAGNGIRSVQSVLASPLPLGKTASELVAGPYVPRAKFFRELYWDNWDFLISLWTKHDTVGKYLDIDGIRMTDTFPDNVLVGHKDIFIRTFFIYLFFGDNYDSDIVLEVEKVIRHVRQYVDAAIDVRIKPGDTVIDAGAWLGDFSAYAAHKGAVAHAFEPTRSTYELLLRTVALNEGRIIPVMKGLGAENGTRSFGVGADAAANRILKGGESFAEDGTQKKISIDVITLDDYVEENNLQRVDFIKADVEGAEEELLAGATNTLRNFAPKLSFSTYHAANDRVSLQETILRANPTYKFVQTRACLFGAGEPMAP